MAEIKVNLKPSERDALRKLAQQEMRDPRAQAAFIIRAELKRQGLIASPDGEISTGPSETALGVALDKRNTMT